jgi:hypothetical protein
MASVVDHYANHLAPLYEWMLGDVQAALLRGAADLDGAGLVDGTGVAVDLGAGVGMHAVPLAQRDYSVLAIDNIEYLLSALKLRAGELPIRVVNGDLLEFRRYLQQPAQAIMCMGDTLTHLPSLMAVEKLITDVSASLASGGVFVATFRDYVTEPRSVEQRFIPVRSDAQRILTCCLEYKDDVVLVHDLVHEWIDGRWIQRISSYPKLRLAPAWVAGRLQSHGLDVRVSGGPAGMARVMAMKAHHQRES